MARDVIEYEKLIDEAMRAIVRNTLIIIEEVGALPGDHHFFITFSTTHPGVMIPKELLARYPREMTIVLQHQFWDMEVDEHQFSITLSFENVHHGLTVPFDALTGFADPSVRFGLQFRRLEEHDDATESGMHSKGFATSNRKTAQDSPSDGSNVVSLDSFRKN